MNSDVDVAVVGAGIAGLTAAFELQRAGLDVRVYETSDHVGGRMTTVRTRGYTIDTGAEQISPNGYPATWELLQRLGFHDREVPPIGRPIAIWRGERAHAGFGSLRGMLTGAGLCSRARMDLPRLRARIDPDRPDDSALGHTTVAQLGRHHHPDLLNYMLQPAASFCFWDPERSAAAVLLALHRAAGDTASWRTYAAGMDAPCRQLAKELDVITETPVREVVSGRSGAWLRTDTDSFTARHVLLCVPAPIAAQVHANPPSTEAEFLRACTFTRAVKVSLLLDTPRELPKRPYLLVTPRAEEDVLAGAVCDHAKHPGRVPPGKGLVTAFPNTTTTRELYPANNEEVIARVAQALDRYLPGIEYRDALVHRHPYALPECTPAALTALPQFRARPIGPVDYAGDWTTLRPHSEGAVRAAALAASRTLRRVGSPLPT